MTDESSNTDVGSMHWRKASYSGASGCVEVAEHRDGVAVRDSKNPGQPFLRFNRVEWRAFVAGVKAGEFDRHL